MTNFQQLHFTASGYSEKDYENIVETLENLGALAVTLSDAGNQPVYEPELETLIYWDKTIITVLLPENTAPAVLIENLSQTLAIEKNQFYTEKLLHQEWERVCKDAFKPRRFGQNLWICPSWEVVSHPNAVIVKLDPGLAFGTGAHPTTQLCLDWLSLNASLVYYKTIIDYGCGSGILGIAALKLGAKKVIGVDIDPQALTASAYNAGHNHVDFKTFTPEQFKSCGIQADIIIANILANPLIELKEDFTAYLKPGGKLILSGILTEQADWIKNAYNQSAAVPLKFNACAVKNGWARLAFSMLKTSGAQ